MSIPTSFKSLKNLREQEILAPYTYMKVGGPADFFFVAESPEDLCAAVLAAKEAKIPLLILGGGSNVVMPDEGIRGLVVRNRADKTTINADGLTVESGVIVNQLVRQACVNGFAGLEEFLGVPGTVGGAIYNNSHYLKRLIGDYIDSVDVVTRVGERKTLSQEELYFAYDYSILQETHDIVLTATFKLEKGDPNSLWAAAEAALKRRRDTQPLEMPSSGCMFKNIGEANQKKFNTPGSAAGMLIDLAGLKGLKIGGAMVSDKHANFIVNTGIATAQDIVNLSNLVIQKVKAKFGVTLEREVFVIGEKNS